MNIVTELNNTIRLEMVSTPGNFDGSVTIIHKLEAFAGDIIVTGEIAHCVKVDNLRTLFSLAMRMFNKEDRCLVTIRENRIMTWSVTSANKVRVFRQMETIPIINTFSGIVGINNEMIEMRVLIKESGDAIKLGLIGGERRRNIVMHYTSLGLSITSQHRYFIHGQRFSHDGNDLIIRMNADMFRMMWLYISVEDIENIRIENILTISGKLLVRQISDKYNKSGIIHNIEMSMPSNLFISAKIPPQLPFGADSQLYLAAIPPSDNVTYMVSTRPLETIIMSQTYAKLASTVASIMEVPASEGQSSGFTINPIEGMKGRYTLLQTLGVDHDN